MKRTWVHLSPTVEIARKVGLRKTRNLVVLEIDVVSAIRDGTRFYKATDEVYPCGFISLEYVRKTG